ncbi:MAG TPA: membrane-bound lytic murein transglycosylase MltF [Nevskiaceae bacterium]|nr:membrane-bound lytic murein transglycosylase MltF [Nevskiaceae bacterium]
MNAAANPKPADPEVASRRPAFWFFLIFGGIAYAVLSTCSPRTGTLSMVKSLGVMKVATVNSPTSYYVGPNGPTGFDYDLAKGFAERLGVQLQIEEASGPAEALAWVRDGRVNFAAAGLNVTAAREKQVHFSHPLLSVVPQLVYALGLPKPKDLGELDGRLRVPRGSVAAERLRELKKTTFPSLNWEESDDQEVETLLYQVANEQLNYTIANSDIIAINQHYYPKLRVAFDLSDAQDIAWAFPQDDDSSLYDAADDYLRDTGGAQLARLRDRYFGHVEQVDYYGSVTLAADVRSRLPRYRALFEKAAAKFNLDWRLLAAMGYQESHWDPNAISPTGVRGIMMLTNDTATLLNIADRVDPAQSIAGGARYFHDIVEQIPDEIADPNERTWMALAAYNMGIGHLLDARELTRSLGGDPNHWLDVRNTLALLTQPKWYSKLKYGYARGFEGVTYVGNVRTYYDMLMWIESGGAGPRHVEVEPPLQPPTATPQAKKRDLLDINTPVL